MTMAFAEGTTVAVSKTRGEIEGLVEKYGATRFASGWIDDEHAAISFAAKGRLVRFTLPLPKREEVIALVKKTPKYRYYTPPTAVVDNAIAAEQRRRWRCLLLALKAKLEAVGTGIETFEQAFLANIVTADNMTVYEQIKMAESGVRLLDPVE
jgi:hypothetical protein